MQFNVSLQTIMIGKIIHKKALNIFIHKTFLIFIIYIIYFQYSICISLLILMITMVTKNIMVHNNNKVYHLHHEITFSKKNVNEIQNRDIPSIYSKLVINNYSSIKTVLQY